MVEGTNYNGQRNVTGRAMSTYNSPTLDRGPATGLVKNGPDRMGERLEFPKIDGSSVFAEICDSVFFDREGEKQDGWSSHGFLRRRL